MYYINTTKNKIDITIPPKDSNINRYRIEKLVDADALNIIEQDIQINFSSTEVINGES